jgi:hypothetical protein
MTRTSRTSLLALTQRTKPRVVTSRSR